MRMPCLLRDECCVPAQPSDVRWASRWDTYLLMMDDQIHWFSIINSLMIVLFLSGMVAMIMMRTLHRDISNYNQLETAEEVQDETGWKLVRGQFAAHVLRRIICSYCLATLCSRHGLCWHLTGLYAAHNDCAGWLPQS